MPTSATGNVQRLNMVTLDEVFMSPKRRCETLPLHEANNAPVRPFDGLSSIGSASEIMNNDYGRDSDARGFAQAALNGNV
jgi:hypothetical protein